MAEIYFVNYPQSKKHNQRYKIKELLYKAIGKFRIKTPKWALGLGVRFLTVPGRWQSCLILEGEGFSSNFENQSKSKAK